MKDNKFEQVWREALANASEKPPQNVWRQIDRKITDESNFDSIIASKFSFATQEVPSGVWDGISQALESENTFENEIKTVLEPLALAPPALIWENIEDRLNEEEDSRPIVVFWQNKWLRAGIAAMLIALLSTPLLNNWIEKGSRENLGQKSFSSSSELNLKEEKNANKTTQSVTDTRVANDSKLKPNNKAGLAEKKPKINRIEEFSNVAETDLSELNDISKNKNITTVVKSILSTQTIKSLEKKSYSQYGTSLTLKRVKLALPVSEEEELLKEKSRSWLGFISGLAPFDPNISITNFERQALVSAGNVPNSFFEFKSVIESSGVANGNNVFEIPLSQPFNNIRTGSAINLGLDYGFKMAKNFSFQTGARYLRSSSFIESNVYSYNPSTGNVSTFLESHYFAKRTSARSNTLISSAVDVKNAYQFLMIPLQLGYHLPLFKKVELHGSAGISGDFMVNNILDETPEGGSKLTPGNSAYKAINVSGIGGLRVNYQVNQNWDASIGANYQQALRSGVDETQNFSFRPRFFGVNYGIHYKLN